MDIFDAIRKFYNVSGVHPTTDPDNLRSQFAVDRYEDHLRPLIKPGMRALDLGCNAGLFTFVMEEMGAIATGIDFAEIPILHAKKVAEKTGSYWYSTIRCERSSVNVTTKRNRASRNIWLLFN